MDLNTLVITLREQAAAKSKIVLDNSVLPDAAVRQKIRAAFALKIDSDLTIAGVTPGDIKEPGADGVLKIDAGKADLLEQKDVPMVLSFTATNGTIDVVIVAKMSDSWQFKNSFKDLDTFPFTQLDISHARFVYSTVVQSSFVWPDDSDYKIRLEEGLSFLSDVTPTFVTSIPSPVRELIGNVSRKLYGSLKPEDGQNWPVGTLRAPLTDARFEIGDDTIKLSLGAPKLAVRIGKGTDDFPVQPLDLLVEAELQNGLRIGVAIPVSGDALEVSATPLLPDAPIAALIKQLPGGDFGKYIPQELDSLEVFDKVGLKNFSLIVNSDRKVSYVGLSISTLKEWDLIPSLLTLKELSLNLETVAPVSLDSMRAHISGSATFLRQIFTDDLSFDVELEKQDSWKVKTISGAYYGTVSLSKIVSAVLAGRVTVPSELEHITFSNFGIDVYKDTDEYNYNYYGSVETILPILNRELTASVNVAVTRSGTTSNLGLNGGLVIGEQVFSFGLDLAKSKLEASWKKQGRPLGFGDIASAFGWDDMPPMPEGLDLALTGATVNYNFKAKTLVVTAKSANYGQIVFASLKKKKDDKQFYLFALDVPLNLKFTEFPLVGESIPTDKPVGVEKLQIIVASEELTEADVKDLPTGIFGTQFMPAKLIKGLTLAAKLELNGPHEIVLPLSTGAKTEAAPMALAAPTYEADAKWFPVQKTLGPVHFDKVGVQYQGSTLRFLLNAALSAAGLTLSVDGLSVGSSLTHFKPQFELRGLGVDYKAGDIEIGGAFLRTVRDGQDSYDGAAVIKTRQVVLSALGSYTKVNDEPSLFIYAFLDYPLGGPSFFFVTGLAAGFGYNRRLIAPSIDDVAKFPLITQAVGGRKPKDVMEALTALHHHIPPSSGSIFFAVGVKFTSFKLVNSFALLTVEFGDKVAINLLGLSTAIVPTPETGKNVTPLAQVQIAWKATFNPDDGCLGIDARLTPNSYILSKDCRLSGGYAFYSWFSGTNAGDFVQTLGGYHSKFVVPDHYPKVPRLAFDWRVSNSLTIQGNAFYALTGSALMAGGYLEVLFKEGELRAWLKVGAEFLIAWKPYHYDASLSISVGASYTFDINLLFGHVRFTLSVDVGAQLHLWGPDFSGTASIDISVISFTIAFGAGASQSPAAIKEWSTFQQSFLPAEKVCTISVKGGLVRNIEKPGENRWVINPKEFALTVDSAIPFKSAPSNGEELVKSPPPFGVGPMNVNAERLTSILTLSVTKDSKSVDREFQYLVIKKQVPIGMWGEKLAPPVDDRGVITDSFIKDVPAGVQITPRAHPDSGKTEKVARKVFDYSSVYYPKGEKAPAGDAFSWEAPSAFVPKDLKDTQARNAIRDSVAKNQRRDELLKDLGITLVPRIRETVAADFMNAPKIGTVKTYLIPRPAKREVER